MKPENKNRALVLLRGALGDTLLAWPALSGLSDRLGISELTLVGHPPYLELLAGQPLVNAILDQAQSDWSGLYVSPPQASQWLKGLLDSHKSAVVLARRIPDPAAEGLEQLGLSPVLTAPSRPAEDGREHVVFRMCRKLGVEAPDRSPVIRPSEKGLSEAREFIEAHDLDLETTIVLHPGSGGRHKNWPLPGWFSLSGKLADRYRVVFLLGPAENESADRIREEMHPSAVLAENLSLPVVAGLIHFSRGYIGHDSGVSHLSAMMGKTTLTLFGPTNPAHWAPLGPRVGILSPPEDWVDKGDWSWLEPDMVLEAFMLFREE